MRRTQTILTVTLLTTALLVLALFAGLLIGGPIDFMYRSVPNLVSIRNVATLAFSVAGVILLLAGFAVALPAALQRLSFGAKLLAVLPLWLLLFTLAGAVMNVAHIGTVGTLGNFGLIMLNLAIAWLAVGAVLSAIAVVIAAARAHLGAGSLRTGLTLARLAGVVALVASAAMVATVVIASGSQPQFGGPPGGGEGGQQRRSASTQQASAPVQSPVSTAEAPAGSASGAESTPPAATRAQGPGVNATPEVSAGGGGPATTESAVGGARTGQGNSGGGEGGQRGGDRGGPPAGGPGGGFANMIAAFSSQFGTVGIVVAVLAVVNLIVLLGGLRAPTPVAIASRVGTAFGGAVAAFVVVTVVIGGAMQLIQVPHDNPPANGPIQFDSPQTQALFEGACADCHTNETKWPWYAYVAPGSWLNALHVKDAREQMNLSELGAMPAFRKDRLGEEIEMQLRSGNMPPADYQLLHPSARLTDEQKTQLIAAMKASLAQTP